MSLNTKPKLSVVIPTLGRSILLRTVQSLAVTDMADELDVIIAGHIQNETLLNQINLISAVFASFKMLSISFSSGDSSNKKNAGLAEASTEIVAFLDDDVHVAHDWPQFVLKAFEKPEVGMVSGPSLVPDDLPVMARLSGMALASSAAGYVSERYWKGQAGERIIKWSRIIGCNMAFRKSVIKQIGAFDPKFWPGEEMVVAYQVYKRGYLIVFQPDAWVYHYPRATLWGFVRQIFGYGATRIRLNREGLEFEPMTIMPALWVASLCFLGIGALFCRFLYYLFVLEILLYLVFDIGVTLMTIVKTKKPINLLLVFIIPIMHICYGIAEWFELCCPNKDLSENPRKGNG